MTVVRILLGLVFVVFGLNGFLNFIPVPELAPPAQQFMGLMIDSGYLYVVKALEVIGGALLLVGRRIPLALTLLGPVVVNIVLFHLFLDLAGLPVALVVFALWGALMWGHRARFLPLL